MVKAYIAGKVSGMPEHIVKAKFDAKMFELLEKGIFPLNPVLEIKSTNRERQQLGLPKWTDKTHRNKIMRQCVIWLAECDEIHLLPDWQESKGAIDERDIALKLGIKIVYP
jgi:hypothetical protein